MRPRSILHVEVGGSYGGSLRALEVYLAHSNRARYVHDLLLYYPTPRTGTVERLVRHVATLYNKVPGAFTHKSTRPASNEPHPSVHAPFRSATRTVAGWVRFVQALPIALRLKRRIAAAGYDFVHVNNTFTYQAPTILAARMAGIPVIAHVRNPVPTGLVSRTLLNMTTAIATVSRFYEKELRRWDRSTPIYTCHDSLETPQVDAPASTRLRHSLVSSGEVLVGSVGRLDAQKAYHDLIRAARIVVDRNPGVHFAVAGDGPLRVSLQMLIQSLGLQRHFTLCGYREDANVFLGALDLFVSCSHWEGLPLALLEAMLLNRPFVATAVGGVVDVVADGPASRLVPPRNPASLATATEAAIHHIQHGDRALIHESLARARQLAALTSNPEANARQFEELLA